MFKKTRALFRLPGRGDVTAVIYPAALMMSFALGLANLGIVFFAGELFHATPAQVGWLAGTWSLTYTLSCLLLRPFFGHLPARYLMIASSFLMGICILAMQFVSSIFYLFLFFALYGAFMSMFWPPLMAWLSDGHEGSSLTKRFARYNIMWSIGSITSPYVCGILAENSVRYPLIFGSLVFFITAAFCGGAALLLSKAKVTRTAATDADTSAENNCTPETPLRYPSWLGLFTAFFGFGVILAVFPLAATGDFGLTKATVGLLFLVRALCGTAAFFIIGKTVFWHFRIIPMLLIQLCGAACFALLCFSRSAISIGLLFGLLGAVLSFSYSISVFHGVSGCANRIKRMAIHESTLSAGLICGSAAGGMLYEATSMPAVYAVCAAILAGGTLLQAAIYRLTR